ncbi:MAG: LysR family transcriptional regulator [Myxococcota bacterium]
MPKLEWFAALAAVAEHGGFTPAARALHISQPALHAQVRKLGDALGVTLYVRRGRGLSLTREGERAVVFARDLQRRTRALMAELGGAADTEPVVLAAGEGAMLYLIDEAIGAFARRGSSPLSLLTRDRDGTIEALRSAEAHVGVVAGEAPGQLRAEVIDDVPHRLAMPSRHPWAERARIPLARLGETPLVVAPPGGALRRRLQMELTRIGASLDIGVEARGWELTLHFVGLGLGLAVVNGCCRLPRGIVARPIQGLPSVRYWLLSRPELSAHTGTQVLLDCIRARRRTWRSRARSAVRSA